MKNFSKNYYPLFLIFTYLLLVTAIVELQSTAPHWKTAMHHFMGAFFLAFSFFKLLDLRGFVSAFQKYDLLAEHSKVYGYVYPFIELGLGVGFVCKWNLVFLNEFTLVVMGISALGVIRSLTRKEKIQCACLGTVVNLPLSNVTLLEDILMVAMAAASLLTA